MEITINCTKKQALLIQEAMEEYFKIRLNQFDTVINSLAFDGYDKEEKGFGRRMDCKQELEKTFEQVGKLHMKATGEDTCSKGSIAVKSDNCMDMINVYNALRFALIKASKPVGKPEDAVTLEDLGIPVIKVQSYKF